MPDKNYNTGDGLTAVDHDGAVPTKQIAEPWHLLAVVEDPVTLRRWFRWSYDSHTHSAWRDIGTVHTDTDEFLRWDELPLVRLVSKGIPVCGCKSCGGPR